MFILARGGQTYARLRFHVGPGGDIELPVEVDYSRAFAGSDHAAWLAEYQANVEVLEPLPLSKPQLADVRDPFGDPWDVDCPSSCDGLFQEQAAFLDKQEFSHAV